MCTVFLRLRPGAAWPLLIAAVRDEFLERPWDPPAAHWPAHPSIVGGRDRTAGGTWLAVDSARPAFAAVLNGVRLPPAASRPSRGALPLAALTDSLPSSFAGYDGFHLVLGTLSTVVVWSWDGTEVVRRELPPGDHIIVNDGIDATTDPLVPHFVPVLADVPDPPLSAAPPGGSVAASPDLTSATTQVAWAQWVELLRGDGLPLDDPRALLLRKEFDGTEPGTEEFAGRVYGSGSLALVGLGPAGVRYDFTGTPFTPAWHPILAPSLSR